MTVSFTQWKDIREEHVTRIGLERLEEGKSKTALRVQAHQLRELRQFRNLTQSAVAERMGVTIGRVSQIESGEVSGLDVLERYARALGGCLTVSINFPDVEAAGDEAGTTESSTTISS